MRENFCKKKALSTMKSFQIIDDQLATISFSVTKTLWDKPMIVVATILDFAKHSMFQFPYQKMRPNLKWNSCTPTRIVSFMP